MDNSQGQVVLIKDINPGSEGSDLYGDFVEFNDRLYFSAETSETGDELWVSDGTTDGTQLVADINPDGAYTNSSYPGSLTEYNGKLYFSAFNNETGFELWVSDGTAEGTNLLADIDPDNRPDDDLDYGSFPSNFIEYNGKLYFAASDGENGDELWVSDGTTEGTKLAVDITPGGYSTTPTSFTEFNGKLYFKNITDGVDGEELRVTDGTEEGTSLVANINPGGRDSDPRDLTVFDNQLFFTAEDGENGRELWVTDGTAEGTQLVEDINPGSDNYGSFNSSNPLSLTVFDGELYFTAIDAEIGRELYKLNFEDVTNPGGGTGNIEGTLGDDTIDGTGSAERIKGLAGDDVINALGGDDLVFGDVGNDELDGGSGNDTIYGGVGNDTIVGGAGNNVLVGQEGNDSFVVTPNEGTDTIVDFDPQSDRLILGSGLAFEELSFNNNNILVGDETLATIEGVDTTQLVADSFV